MSHLHAELSPLDKHAFATDDRFQKFLLVLIFFDAISMAISGELPDDMSAAIVTAKLLLNFLDSFTLILFSVEIVLKWIDNFTTFWKSGWNIFDFFVTFLVRLCMFHWVWYILHAVTVASLVSMAGILVHVKGMQ